MNIASFDPRQIITMTPAALLHFEQAIAETNYKVLRLSTRTSGCTGYAYVLDLVDQPQADDHQQQLSDKLTVAIANDSVELVRGTQIDRVQEGINQVIKYYNPNVVSECGCGESFSVNPI